MLFFFLSSSQARERLDALNLVLKDCQHRQRNFLWLRQTFAIFEIALVFPTRSLQISTRCGTSSYRVESSPESCVMRERKRTLEFTRSFLVGQRCNRFLDRIAAQDARIERHRDQDRSLHEHRRGNDGADGARSVGIIYSLARN